MRAIIATLLCLAAVSTADGQELAKATFAGGCFWCMEPPFDKLDGVVSTTSGYTGGRTAEPDVRAGLGRKDRPHRGGRECVYDPRKVTYARLLDVFWRNIDPLTANAQFCDIGSQYRAGIFAHDETQRRLAEATKGQSRSACGSLIVTEIAAAVAVLARGGIPPGLLQEESPSATSFYRASCGRDQRLEAIWGPDAERPRGHSLSTP